jgi:hypothetical protein
VIVRRAAANSGHFSVFILGRRHGLFSSRFLHTESDVALLGATCDFDAEGPHGIAAAIKKSVSGLIVSAI